MKAMKISGWLLVISIMLSACSQPGTEKEDNKETRKVRPVKVMTLDEDTVDRTIEYTANLMAFEEVYYAPAQPGRINKINVEVGDRVITGQTLVRMDQTQLTQALLQVENAKSTFKRMDTLYQLNSISEQQYDQAKTQYEVAVSNLKFLQENTTLTAPFNGIVTGKYYESGEIYSGAPNTQAGKAAILTIMQINPLKAVVNISEKYFPVIKEGMSAEITTDIYPGASFVGTVYKVYPTIDVATRSFKAEIKINNTAERLRPGMFARVEIELKDDKAVLAPAIAVVKQEGTNNRHVFTVDNGYAKKIEVSIGDRFNDKVELVSEEISKGMQLIIAGQAKLMDGDKVEIKN